MRVFIAVDCYRSNRKLVRTGHCNCDHFEAYEQGVAFVLRNRHVGTWKKSMVFTSRKKAHRTIQSVFLVCLLLSYSRSTYPSSAVTPVASGCLWLSLLRSASTKRRTRLTLWSWSSLATWVIRSTGEITIIGHSYDGVISLELPGRLRILISCQLCLNVFSYLTRITWFALYDG